MKELHCVGLPASWLNGWLAAVGSTVLSPQLHLRWTRDGTPYAVLSTQHADPATVLLSAWPTQKELENLPIRRLWPNASALPRNVTVDAFAERAAAARNHPCSWTLSSTITDLHVDEKQNVAHGPFDPPVPKGLTLHDRLRKLRASPTVDELRQSLSGTGKRIESNGLGFDITRMGSGADLSKKWIDPVVETLAFFALLLFPVRGTGTDAQSQRGARLSTIQRGWVKPRASREPPWFSWPAWDHPLDCAAIDALLDAGRKHPKRRSAVKRLPAERLRAADCWQIDRLGKRSGFGIHAAWRSVRYKAKGSADTTRGFGAERLD